MADPPIDCGGREVDDHAHQEPIVMATAAEIVAVLTLARQDQGLSRRQVARLIDPTAADGRTVARWERGQRVPDAGRLLAWAGAVAHDVLLVPRESPEKAS